MTAVEENKIPSLCRRVTPWNHASCYKAKSCRIVKGKPKESHVTSKLQERERSEYYNTRLVGKGNNRTYVVSCNLLNCATLPSMATLHFRGTRLKCCPLKTLHVPAEASGSLMRKRASKHQIKIKQSLTNKCFPTFLINHWKVTLPSHMARWKLTDSKAHPSAQR